jgi:thiaminase/transcriptional activator TenA
MHGKPTLRFTDRLREAAREAWEAATTHRFTQEVRQNALPESVFLAYVLQEYAFVKTSATVLGYAVAKAPALDAQAHLARALVGLTTDQEDFFRRAFRELGVTDAALVAPLPWEVEAFRDFVLRVAATESYEAVLTTILGAEWLYVTWCRAVSAPITHPLLREWVALHVTPAFEGGVNWLKQQLDERGPTLAKEKQDALAYLFRRTLELEVLFHDAVYG